MVSEKEIKAWYNQKHSTQKDKSWRPPAAYSTFLDLMKAQSGKMFLDVGCGTGYLLREADSRGLDTYGVDISVEGVKLSKSNSPNSKIYACKGEAMDFPDNTFDYVTCLGALEHFLDINKGMAEMLRVAKEDATFCIVVPNIDWLVYRKTKDFGTDQQDINETLLTLKQWKEIFIKAGFAIHNIHRDKWGKKMLFSLARKKSLATKLYYELVWITLPLKYNYQFIFIMKRA